MSESDVDERITACSHLMAQILERLATQIDDFADGLLLMAALMVNTHGSSDKVVGFSTEIGRLTQQLRGEVEAAQRWERHAIAGGWHDFPGLQTAFPRLQRSVDRAALFLGRADILLATTGDSTESIKEPE